MVNIPMKFRGPSIGSSNSDALLEWCYQVVYVDMTRRDFVLNPIEMDIWS